MSKCGGGDGNEWKAKATTVEKKRQTRERARKKKYIGRKDLHNVHYYSLDSLLLAFEMKTTLNVKGEKRKKKLKHGIL